MKKNVLVVLFMASTISLFSQVQLNSANDVINYLQGEWVLQSVSGGFSGGYIYTYPGSYIQRDVFNRVSGTTDSILHSSYKNNILQYSVKQKLTFGSSIWNNKWKINTDLVIFANSTNQLSLHENCYDCYQYDFLKVNNPVPPSPVSYSVPTFSSISTVILLLFLLLIGSMFVYKNSKKKLLSL